MARRRPVANLRHRSKMVTIRLQRRGGKKGLATLCIGGGMGIALTVER